MSVADPPPSSEERDPVEVLAEEFVSRHRSGERPPLAEYTERHPALADRIRRLFPTLLLLEGFQGGGSDNTPQAEATNPQAPLVSHAPPQRLGDFTILREVGRGGMGVVYEAMQETLGRRVALKVLRPHPLRDPVSLERFRREARTAARLHHTNIVSVFGAGEQDGTLFIAMQFIDGAGLDAVLADHRRRGTAEPPALTRSTAPPGLTVAGGSSDVIAADTAETTFTVSQVEAPATGLRSGPHQGSNYFRQVARLGAQVADALAHAHGLGVVHRDVKPANVLVDGQGAAWVTDFGLAKAEGVDDLTSPGFVVGTLRYMAPERFDGTTGPAGDIYGLGATLYELLTLRPAFSETARHLLVDRILKEEPARPRRLDPRIPRDLETIVLKAMAKEPARRYATAAALADDLRRFLDGRPVAARPIGALGQTWRWARRHPAVAGLACALLLTLTAGLGVSLYFGWMAQENYEQAEARRLQVEVALQVVTQAELKAKAAAEQALQAESKAKDAASKAEQSAERALQAKRTTDAINAFFRKEILAAARPEEKGRDVTLLEALDRGVEKVGTYFGEFPLVEADVRLSLGETYRALGEFDRAAAQLQLAADIREELLGLEDADTLEALNDLALVYHQRGAMAEAIVATRKVLEGFERTLGSVHEKTQTTRGNLATMLQARGELDEAGKLMRRIYELRRQTLGPTHADTLLMLNNLATLQLDQRKLDDAEASLNELLTAVTSAYPDEHPRVLTARNNLANLYHMRGKYKAAAEMMRKTLAVQERVLGPDSPDTLLTMNNLGTTLTNVGNLDEAESYLKRALAGQRVKYKPEHPWLLSTMNNLAVVYMKRGDYAAAEPLLRQSLEGRKRALRPDHLDRVGSYYGLALVLYRQNKKEEVEPLLWEYLERQGRKPATAAEWSTAHAKCMLGDCLAACRRFEEAESLLLEGHGELTRARGTPPDRIADALRALTALYEAWGKPDAAAVWRAALARHKQGRELRLVQFLPLVAHLGQ